MHIKTIILFTCLFLLLHDADGYNKLFEYIGKILKKGFSKIGLGPKNRPIAYKNNKPPEGWDIDSDPPVPDLRRTSTYSNQKPKPTGTTFPRRMKGFNNPNAACYANSLVQSLFNIKLVRESILRSIGSLLKQLLKDYQNDAIKFCDLTRLRIQCFNRETQEDPSDFLMCLLDHKDTSYLKELCSFNMVTEFVCGCSLRRNPQNDFYVNLIIPSERRTIQIQQLIDNNLLGYWENVSYCLSCEKNKQTRTYYNKFSPVLIFVLQLGQQDANHQGLHKVNNFEVDGVHRGFVEVGKKTYELSAGIFHRSGNSIESGHYYAIVKNGNGFVKANDREIEPCGWPTKSRGLYMLFYTFKQNNIH